MTKTMLIDATHPEETRAVVLAGRHLADFDFETSTKRQLKGNIYLAKITRVEPSLQAAFVDYGGNRHGFLAFSEIHPDYYQVPQADRAMLEEIERDAAAKAAANSEAEGTAAAGNGETEVIGGDSAEAEADEERAALLDEQARRRSRLLRSYKIQEVVKRRQIMLVQVVKEERGNKGAALTTYLSLAGRYCVLMPNTPRGGGISR
jgi:ribonuclease E